MTKCLETNFAGVNLLPFMNRTNMVLDFIEGLGSFSAVFALVSNLTTFLLKIFFSITIRKIQARLIRKSYIHTTRSTKTK